MTSRGVFLTLAAIMATTPQEKVDQLNEVIDDGVRSVTVGDQTTTYNTTDSLIRARNDAQARANAAKAREQGKHISRRTMLFHGGRGY